MSSQTVKSSGYSIWPNFFIPLCDLGPGVSLRSIMSTREMMLGWLRRRESVVAAVGISAGASGVVTVGFLGSSHSGGGSRVLVLGIRAARKDSLSIVRRTEMEEVSVD